jgi:integrase
METPRAPAIHKVTAVDVNQFIARRKRDGIANRTVNMCLNLLRVMFKHALMHNYATHNPMVEIKNLHEPFHDRPVLSMTDFNRLLNEAAKVDDPEFVVTWLKVRAYTGMRPSECVYLEWRDFDFARGQVIVRPKNGNPLKDGEFRAIPIHAALRPALVEWKRKWDEVMAKIGKPHDWVFYHPTHPEQRALGYRRSFERACKNAGLPDTTSYHLRHLFLSECVMAGCDLMAITMWAGHGSVRMLEKVYAHLAPRYHADQMAKVGFGGVGQVVPPAANAP